MKYEKHKNKYNDVQFGKWCTTYLHNLLLNSFNILQSFIVVGNWLNIFNPLEKTNLSI